MRKPTTQNWFLQTGGRLAAVSFAVATAAVLQAANVTVSGVLKDQFYTGATRATVANGTATLTYTTALSALEAPSNIADNYAQSVSGWFTPASTGKYTFIISSDDDSDLYLSTDATPGNKKLIAQQPSWGNPLEWTTAENGGVTSGASFSQKRSDTWSPDSGATVPFASGIQLTAGTKYFIQAIHHEGGGGDNLAVTFLKVGGTEPVNGDHSALTGSLISAEFANPTTLTIATDPADTKVAETATATFTVAVATDGEVAPTYQWRRNGTDIPGATQSSYAFQTKASDTGAKFSVVVKSAALTGLASLTATSKEATLTVDAAVELTGFLKHEFFNNGTRATLEGGTAGAPTYTELLTKFETGVNFADNYGNRVSGYFTPAATGKYNFIVASDDDSDLFLSTDADPSNKRLIAQQPTWGNNLEWATAQGGAVTDGANLTQKDSSTWSPDGGTTTPFSAGISLVKGTKYYIEGVHHEGGGGDNFAATFYLTTDTAPANNDASALTGAVISTKVPKGDITISQQPAAVSTIEGVKASFSVAATATGVVNPTFQWQSSVGGAAYANITGATGTSYTTPILVLGDNGTKFRVVISAPGNTVNSSEVLLTVAKDTIPPQVVSAGALKNSGGTFDVGVIFDEALDVSTVISGNFTLSAGTITGVKYIANSSTAFSLQSGVVVTASGLTPGSTYTITTKNLKDLKGNASSAVTTSFKVQALTWVALGDPANHLFPDSTIAVGDSGLNVQAGGKGFWASEDDVNFAYEQISGDFDKVVQIEQQDASSNWARAGLMIRENLNPDSRYQAVHADPYPLKYDGTASNQAYETNRRTTSGGATDSSNPGGTPKYPNVYVRLRRLGSVVYMYRSGDAITWTELGHTDFSAAGDAAALPASMYVGIVYSPEEGNIGSDGDPARQLFTARFRGYGNYTPNKAPGTQSYSIGINFGDDDNGHGGSIGWTEVAGVDAVAQAHWNSLPGNNSDNSGPVALKADAKGVVTTTTATVAWTGSGNTWSSGNNGRGEENNVFTGSDQILMNGYLDTGNATTTQVTVSGLPTQLTSGKYDVVVYTMGGVAGRGGGFRVTDLGGTVLKDYVIAVGPANLGTWKEVVDTTAGTAAEGNYIVFRGLSAKDVIIEGTTENGLGQSGTPRAPINAVEFVSPTGLLDVVVVTPTISIDATGKITFVGKLQSAANPAGPWTDVTGATSPTTADKTSSAKFYRTSN